MMRLGNQQLALLATMASPFSLLVVSDNLSRSLETKGLLAPSLRKSDGFAGITPAGLRVLADHLEEGRIEPLLDPKFTRDRARLYISAKRAA